MKKLYFILFIFILAGCGGGLSSSWNNFTAYYNTFYNAKKDFKAGLRKIEGQPVQINPDLPVRPHPAPANAGAEDFEEAINKGALVLRRHSESKWADNALLLIGKSYYYRQEYFLAIQTFEDLLNFDPPAALRHQAVIWKGRALLDVASYGEGVSFLSVRLQDTERKWKPERKAEAQILLAEHHAQLENWQQSAEILEPIIPAIEDRSFKARSYFLLGQVLQRRGDYIRSFQAYSNVASYFPEYEYVYWAEIKRAEVSRLKGNPDIAISIYRSMLNDDKNFDRRDAINFQLALTYEQQGNYQRAESIYKRILSGTSTRNSTDISADIYYRLGRLYSSNYNDYELAAAYFDSASQRKRNLERDDSNSLASAFGQYVSLKSAINRADSLLTLGRLNRLTQDSVIAGVRRQRRAALKNNRKFVAQTGNTLSNVNANATRDSAQVSSVASFGFLNYRNARRVQDARAQFRSVWGDRPPVDNWRRTNAIGNRRDGDKTTVSEKADRLTRRRGTVTDAELGINIDEIPVTPRARAAVKREQVSLQYRLGNLFFLTLNQPDSAAIYFNKVLIDTTASEVKPKALYSLHELYELQEKADSAAKYRRRIVNEYPSSVFARRVQNRQGEEPVAADDSTALLRDKVERILAGPDTAGAGRERARQLRTLALENPASELAPTIYYQAIREYIQVARDLTAERSDSASVYSGQSWNRVRALIREFKERFPKANQIPKVNGWLEEIRTSGTDRIYSCDELNTTPEVQPDMAAFLRSVEPPDKVKGLNLSGSLRYRLVIGRNGAVESYELLSNRTGLGIEDSYEQAIENSLQFKPVTQNGEAIRISCEVEFPIKQ